jgi:GNAT superfamily N-acetyltransferase
LNLSLKFKQLTISDFDQFEQVKRIYLNSFPASERQKVSVFTERFFNGKNLFFVLINDNNEVVAMCSIFEIQKLNFVLLDYMAVDTNFRNRGIGSILFTAVRDIVIENKKKIIIEVENPLFGVNNFERENRIRFYQKHGAKLLDDIRYILPPMDGKMFEEMKLMISEERDSVLLTKEEIYALIEQMYVQVYNRDENDKLLLEIKHGMNIKKY